MMPGLTAHTWAALSRKKENPTIDLLDRIAVPLGIHLSELFAEPAKDAMPQAGRKPARPLSEQEVIIAGAMFQLATGRRSRSGPHASSIYSRRFRSPAPADVVPAGSRLANPGTRHKAEHLQTRACPARRKPIDGRLKQRFSKSLFGAVVGLWGSGDRNAQQRDFRKGMEGLATLVRKSMRADPSSRAVGPRIKLVCGLRMGSLAGRISGRCGALAGAQFRRSWKGWSGGLFMGHVRRRRDRERDSFSRRRTL